MILKNSKKRNQIYQLIATSDEHLSAYDVLRICKERGYALSLATIYNNLNCLSDENVIKRVKVPGYEDHFDRTLDDHDHFFCTCCHCLIDIDLDQQFNPYIDKYGNKFERRETTYFGLCSSCLKKNH